LPRHSEAQGVTSSATPSPGYQQLHIDDCSRRIHPWKRRKASIFTTQCNSPEALYDGTSHVPLGRNHRSHLKSRLTHTAPHLFVQQQLHDVVANAASCFQHPLPGINIDTNMSPFRAVSLVLIPVIAILIGLFSSYPSLCPSLCAQTCHSNTRKFHSGYFEYECAGKPHHSSWTSWWHPHRSEGTSAEHKQGAGSITGDWNILYHLGGNGPWVEKIIDIVGGGIAVPKGCQVEQVHMVGHARGNAPEQDALLM
jgi:hypothetical protein